MSEETTSQANSTEKLPSTIISEEHEPTLEDHADKVLHSLLRKYPGLTIVISSREGKCLTSTLGKKRALEFSSTILNFTDKAKVLTRRLLNEELTFVRIKARTNEIVVMFDELMEIITIQENEEEKPNKI